jgi:hypothetical protein
VHGPRRNRRARRAGVVATSLAAAAVAAVVTGAPAGAEVQNKTRTDNFTFTVTGTSTSVTCGITSTLQYDTSAQKFTASTVISGTERSECRSSYPEVTVVESDGSTHHAQGYGGIVNMSYGPVGNSLRSAHFIYFQACNCSSPVRNQSLPK